MQRSPADSSSGLIRFSFPSDLRRVGDAVEQITSCCLFSDAAAGSIRFRLCTVVAEALANAMFYGNGNNPDLSVSVELRLLPDRVEVMVVDQGDGFDPSTVPHPSQISPESQTGRGLFLIHQFADEVSFNLRGNAITITLLRA